MWTSLTSALLTASATLGSEELDKKHYVYVATESDDHVHLVEFDPSTRRATIARTIQVGYQPTEIEGPHGLTISPDGKHWFVTMAHGKPYGILYKYETATNELVGQCELGLFPATMQISDATGLLYCVNFDLHGDMSPSSVSVVDPDEMVEVARTTTGPMPHGSRISPDGLRHYSCAMMSGQLFEIDTVTFEVARTLQLTTEDEPSPADHGETKKQMRHGQGHGEHGQGHGEHDQGHGDKHGKEAGHGKDHGMKAMPDHGSHAHAASSPTWVFPHPTAPRIYVALNGVAQVVEIDTEQWKIVRRFPTDKGPYNVEISPDERRMLVTYKSAQGIGIWDLESGKELARLTSSRRVPHGVVISKDSRYAFVSCEAVGAEKGTLDVIDLGTNELVATVELGLQAGGLYYWKAE